MIWFEKAMVQDANVIDFGGCLQFGWPNVRHDQRLLRLRIQDLGRQSQQFDAGLAKKYGL